MEVLELCMYPHKPYAIVVSFGPDKMWSRYLYDVARAPVRKVRLLKEDRMCMW
jgi:hypothetical protein